MMTAVNRKTPKKKPFQVLIVSYANWAGLARLPRVLHQAGCHISLLSPADNLVARSRYISRHIPAPSGRAAFFAGLQSHLEASAPQYHWIIPGDDPVLYGLAARRKEPWVASILPVNPLGNRVDFLLDKFEFPWTARHHGIPVPETWLCQTLKEAHHAASLCQYPVVVKRRVSFSGQGVAIAHDSGMLEDIVSRIKPGAFFAVQAFVPGQVGTATALYNHGKLLCWVSFYCLKTFPHPAGQATQLEVAYLPGLQPILEALGQLSQIHGFSGIDFIHQPETGKLVVLEQHARPTPHVSLGKQTGADFAAAINAMLNQTPWDSPLSQHPKQKTRIRLFPQDLYRAFFERDIQSLLAWHMYVPWWRDLPWQDPALLVPQLKGVYQWGLKCWSNHKKGAVSGAVPAEKTGFR